MKKFAVWLEARLGNDPQELRRMMMDYLGLKFDPKKGMAITMDTFDTRTIHQMADKIKGWTALSSDQKVAALDVLYNKPGANLGDLADALAGGPQPLPAPEKPAEEGL